MIASGPTCLNGQQAGPSGPALAKGMDWIPGESFLVISNGHYQEEAPVRQAAENGFWMDVNQVTNPEFLRFVNASDYVTHFEQVPKVNDYPSAIPELLAAGSAIFTQPHDQLDLGNPHKWWK